MKYSGICNFDQKGYYGKKKQENRKERLNQQVVEMINGRKK
jgi:hypothetical protein